MKKVFALVCVVLIASTLAVISFAHPGNTDGNGGHYNRSTGEYHYHHGYSEHQHPKGICPYDYDDNTHNYSSKTSHDRLDNIKQVFFSIGFGIAIGMTLTILFSSLIPDKAIIPFFVIVSFLFAVISFFAIKW